MSMLIHGDKAESMGTNYKDIHTHGKIHKMVKCCSKCKKTRGDDEFNSINFRRKNAVVKQCLQCRLYTVKSQKKRSKPYRNFE